MTTLVMIVEGWSSCAEEKALRPTGEAEGRNENSDCERIKTKHRVAAPLQASSSLRLGTGSALGPPKTGHRLPGR
jgi:hypothetical protein